MRGLPAISPHFSAGRVQVLAQRFVSQPGVQGVVNAHGKTLKGDAATASNGNS
ncbi:MAG: hypothetical protein KME27_24545 [Lyngbya sp. HA4199-MV5]|nr:hypothetical protein [Lyngbya sp. HA4199-MV5]